MSVSSRAKYAAVVAQHHNTKTTRQLIDVSQVTLDIIAGNKNGTLATLAKALSPWLQHDVSEAEAQGRLESVRTRIAEEIYEDYMREYKARGEAEWRAINAPKRI